MRPVSWGQLWRGPMLNGMAFWKPFDDCEGQSAHKSIFIGAHGSPVLESNEVTVDAINGSYFNSTRIHRTLWLLIDVIDVIILLTMHLQWNDWGIMNLCASELYNNASISVLMPYFGCLWYRMAAILRLLRVDLWSPRTLCNRYICADSTCIVITGVEDLFFMTVVDLYSYSTVILVSARFSFFVFSFVYFFLVATACCTPTVSTLTIACHCPLRRLLLTLWRFCSSVLTCGRHQRFQGLPLQWRRQNGDGGTVHFLQ